MREFMRKAAIGFTLGLLALFLVPGTANANESIPALQWPSVAIGNNPLVAGGPGSSLMVGCSNDGSAGSNGNLRTYDSSGQLVRSIPNTGTIDGVDNCIQEPAVDKDGDVYGFPIDQSGASGPNLLAYEGNTLKWKYPASCYGSPVTPVVGADGNIYTLVSDANGEVHLIGLTTEVESGQVQPEKVLDITVPSCDKLTAYKYGIMLDNAFGTGGPYFYGYSGESQGQAPAKSAWGEPAQRVNFHGRVFVSKGGTSTPRISMYDSQDQSDWTYSFAAGTSKEDVRPTPDGGVVVLAKLPNGETALVILTSTGQKLREVSLPDTDSEGNEYTGAWINVDTNGNVAVVQSMSIPDGSTTVHGTFIGMYDIQNNNWPYTTIMKGDLDDPQGPAGYSFHDTYNGDSPIALSESTIGINVGCQGNCDHYGPSLYPVEVSDAGMDYPRGEVLKESGLSRYVSLGDSFSSGQGAGSYDEGTVTATNKCYKSANAYARVLAGNPDNALSLRAFRACGGAVTSDIESSSTYPDVDPQDTVLEIIKPKIVTISIGGNDIGFGEVIKTCADPTKDCDGAFSLANSYFGAILDRKLQDVYFDILQKAPDAEVYVVGYPPMVASGSSGCLVGEGNSLPFFGADRIQKAVDLLESLNGALSTNVATIRSLGADYERLHFVDAAASNSPFAGHDICSSDPFFNGLTISDINESFHPNSEGQEAYSKLIESYL